MRYGHFERFVYPPSRKRVCTGPRLERFTRAINRVVSKNSIETSGTSRPDTSIGGLGALGL